MQLNTALIPSTGVFCSRDGYPLFVTPLSATKPKIEDEHKQPTI